MRASGDIVLVSCYEPGYQPIAIASPAAFLRQAAMDLGLTNVEVHGGRVESWKPASPFAVVISRAFAELAAFITSCRHLVSAEGVLAAMKGILPRDELERLPVGCECGKVIALKTPLLDAERHLVLCSVTP